jgi:hypothetical protein
MIILQSALWIKLDDQEDPMKAQDRFIQSVMQSAPQPGQKMNYASVKWWAQRDLESHYQLDRSIFCPNLSIFSDVYMSNLKENQ